jgi:hypothetical protein
MILYGTQCTEQDCGWLGMVSSVWSGIVDGFGMVPKVWNRLCTTGKQGTFLGTKEYNWTMY